MGVGDDQIKSLVLFPESSLNDCDDDCLVGSIAILPYDRVVGETYEVGIEVCSAFQGAD